MLKTIKLNKSAFTLVELLVVIAIIGIISTLAVVSLVNARESARDAKRIADVRQIQTALELYYNDAGFYPLTGEIDNSIATGSNIYMQSFPTAPTPADGDCSDEENEYTYTSSDGLNYTLEFCIGSGIGELSGGSKIAIPGGITNSTSSSICDDSLTDSRDSNTYPIIQIGDKCWMAKNLAYLPVVHSNTQFNTQGTNSLPGYGVSGYNGSDVATAKTQTNYTTYGVLYNFYAVNQVSICPTGWHVPTNDELTTLTTYLGGTSVAGAKMKEAGITHWCSSNTGTNESGFKVLPGGSRGTNGSFYDVGNVAYFWSSSINASNNAWYRNLYCNDAEIYAASNTHGYGFSVRCLQD